MSQARDIVVIVAVVAMLGLQVWTLTRPPQHALLMQFAEMLGRKEATSLIIQAGNRELQQQLAACQQIKETPK